MLDWFIKESGHPGFKHFTPSKKCPKPEFIKDECHADNTDKLGNPDVKNVVVNGSLDFSLDQNLSCRTSVYEIKECFSTSITGGKKPTLLACGGNYDNLKDVGVEKIWLQCFHLGCGGPEMKRRNKVSIK